MLRRLVATSKAPQIMVLSMLRSFGEIGPQIDQIWAWLSRGHRWSPGVRNPLKSSVTGPSLLVNCYLEIKFHKIIRVTPPPPKGLIKTWEGGGGAASFLPMLPKRTQLFNFKQHWHWQKLAKIKISAYIHSGPQGYIRPKS